MSEMFSKPDWNELKRRRKRGRSQRRRSAKRYLPRLRKLCASNGVEMSEVDGGYQFRYREYVINWLTSTNRVLIQYRLPGHDRTVTFRRDGKEGKPRIQVALEELIDLYTEPKCYTHRQRACG